MGYPGALCSHLYNTQKAGWRQDQRSQWCKDHVMRISELILEATGWSKDRPLCGNIVSLFLFRSAQAIILRKEISGFSDFNSQIHTSLMKITFSSCFKVFPLYVLCALLRSRVYMCAHFCVTGKSMLQTGTMTPLSSVLCLLAGPYSGSGNIFPGLQVVLKIAWNNTWEGTIIIYYNCHRYIYIKWCKRKGGKVFEHMTSWQEMFAIHFRIHFFGMFLFQSFPVYT